MDTPATTPPAADSSPTAADPRLQYAAPSAGPYGPAPHGYPTQYGPPGYLAPGYLGATHRPARPANHLALAIIATILGFWPFGIPAIVYATKVNSSYEQGDIAGAQRASSRALLWALLSAGVAALMLVLFLALMAAAVTFG